MILLLDNHDSFVHNLARYAGELGFETTVVPSDSITVANAEALRPSHIIISPGPCTPGEAGVSTDVIRELGGRIPMLGVCLGHQCIAEAYGGQVVRARKPLHGKSAPVFHEGQGILRGLPSPLNAARYHSLIVEPESLPDVLRITARSQEGEIMALEHASNPVFGVQFHPESAATEHGYRLLANFLGMPGQNSLPSHADLGRTSP